MVILLEVSTVIKVDSAKSMVDNLVGIGLLVPVGYNRSGPVYTGYIVLVLDSWNTWNCTLMVILTYICICLEGGPSSVRS